MQVSELGRGVPSIAAMVNITRIHNAAAAVSLMRRIAALAQASGPWAPAGRAFAFGGSRPATHAARAAVSGRGMHAPKAAWDLAIFKMLAADCLISPCWQSQLALERHT
jgi:hypothetical protein